MSRKATASSSQTDLSKAWGRCDLEFTRKRCLPRRTWARTHRTVCEASMAMSTRGIPHGNVRWRGPKLGGPGQWAFRDMTKLETDSNIYCRSSRSTGQNGQQKKNMSTMVDTMVNSSLSNITRLIANLLIYTLDFISRSTIRKPSSRTKK